jgi:hypothetical protein
MRVNNKGTIVEGKSVLAVVSGKIAEVKGVLAVVGGKIVEAWKAITGIKYIMTGVIYHYEGSSSGTYKYIRPRNEDGSLGDILINQRNIAVDVANLCKSGEYAWNANTDYYGYPYTWDEANTKYVRGTYINFDNLLDTAFAGKYAVVKHYVHRVSADGKYALVVYTWGKTSGSYVYGGAGVALFKMDNGVVSFDKDIGEVYSWSYSKSSWFDVYYETSYPSPSVVFQASDDLSKFYIYTYVYNDFTPSLVYKKQVYARQADGTYTTILTKDGVAHGNDFLTCDGKYFILRRSYDTSNPYTFYYLTDTNATSLGNKSLSNTSDAYDQRYNPQLQMYYYRGGGYIYQFVLSETGATTLGSNYFSPVESIKDETNNGVYILSTNPNSDDSSLQNLCYKKTSRDASGLITAFTMVDELMSGVKYKAMKFIDVEADIK